MIGYVSRAHLSRTRLGAGWSLDRPPKNRTWQNSGGGHGCRISAAHVVRHKPIISRLRFGIQGHLQKLYDPLCRTSAECLEAGSEGPVLIE